MGRGGYQKGPQRLFNSNKKDNFKEIDNCKTSQSLIQISKDILLPGGERGTSRPATERITSLWG